MTRWFVGLGCRRLQRGTPVGGRGGILFILAFLFCAVFTPAGPVQADALRLSTLEWPPFTGVALSGQGQVAQRVRAICEAAGLSPEFSFVPWRRVLQEARSGISQGYFPEYRSAEREREFLYSVPVGCSVLGLVHRRDAAPHWERLEDLAPYRIGVVAGYVNSEEFDLLVSKGVLQTVACKSDDEALRMLAAGRLDAAVMDREVFAYLRGQGDLSAAPLELHPLVLAVHTLHVCFPNTPAGRELLDRFDRAATALGRVDCSAFAP